MKLITTDYKKGYDANFLFYYYRVYGTQNDLLEQHGFNAKFGSEKYSPSPEIFLDRKISLKQIFLKYYVLCFGY